ncbi:MAG TPA: ferredoxin [Pseudonocardia sp.]
MQVSIEQEKCITAGQCVLAAPAVFDQDDDGIVVLLQESPPADLADSVYEAADLCPAQLIRIQK